MTNPAGQTPNPAALCPRAKGFNAAPFRFAPLGTSTPCIHSPWQVSHGSGIFNTLGSLPQHKLHFHSLPIVLSGLSFYTDCKGAWHHHLSEPWRENPGTLEIFSQVQTCTTWMSLPSSTDSQGRALVPWISQLLLFVSFVIDFQEFSLGSLNWAGSHPGTPFLLFQFRVGGLQPPFQHILGLTLACWCSFFSDYILYFFLSHLLFSL